MLEQMRENKRVKNYVILGQNTPLGKEYIAN